MRKGIYDILRGAFLTSDRSADSWRFIGYCTLLAIIMIASSHKADQKVFEIADLKEEVREAKSRFVETRKRLMQVKMETRIINKMKDEGLQVSSDAPTKIIVEDKEE
jgi:cell division protein FtsL